MLVKKFNIPNYLYIILNIFKIKHLYLFIIYSIFLFLYFKIIIKLLKIIY
jgi:hypothetical protein